MFIGGNISAIVPSNSSVLGGTTVTISGYLIGNGSDITSVQLAGVTVASIVAQSSNTVTVLSARATPRVGKVVVRSITRGVTTALSAFSYGPGMQGCN